MDKSCLQLTSSTVWLSDLEAPSPPFSAPCSLLRQNPFRFGIEKYAQALIKQSTATYNARTAAA